MHLFCINHAGCGYAVDQPSELHQEITDQDGIVHGGEFKALLRQAAIESKRLDLIATCFAHSGTKSWTLKDINAMPASDFKTKAVIAMIRAPSKFWPRDGEEATVFGRSMLDPNFVLVEPFSTVVKELLPGKKFTVDTVRYQGRRNKLANELLAAYQKKGGPITEEELQALQSIPLALNAAAEGGTDDPAYTRIPPTEMERFMREAYKVPEWVPPAAKPKSSLPTPQPPKPQAVETPTSSSNEDFSMIWIGGSVAAVVLGWWWWRGGKREC
jgi:hypothetical protein